MKDFQWGIPITDPDETRRITAMLDEFHSPGESIPEEQLRAMEEIRERKLGVAYSWPDAIKRIEGI